jgi:hypothetical protein
MTLLRLHFIVSFQASEGKAAKSDGLRTAKSVGPQAAP